MTRRTANEAELEANAKMYRAWRKWHREEREVVLLGPHGAVLAELFRFFKHLDNVKPAQLIGFAQSINWTVIPYETRLVVIHELNNAITSWREKRGLDPISDPLPHEPESPYRTIRKIVLTASPHNEGAHRGGARPT
jgi:hypothetical protein